MEIIEHTISLTFDELRVLLYSQGFKKCEGIYMPRKLFLASDVIAALKKLVECGLLTIEQERQFTQKLPIVFGTDADIEDSKDPEEIFYIREDLLKMITIIGQPQTTEILDVGESKKIFCYITDDGVVTSERYVGRKDTVRLMLLDAEKYGRLKAEIGGTVEGLPEEVLI